MNMLENEQWAGFEGRIWKEEINVRDFIQKNYKPYDGDESFLAGPTAATEKLWGKLQELQKILKMVHSSKTKYYYRQLKTVRKTIQTYICEACYQMVVYTAITHIYMAYWKWQKRMALKTCMYTHS